MNSLTRAVGAALIVIGIVAYLTSGAASVTALIPAFLGVVLVALGIVAKNERYHAHAIHGALLVALLGLLGTLSRAVDISAVLSGNAVERPSAVVASFLTAVCCLVFLAFGVRSFVNARRAR